MDTTNINGIPPFHQADSTFPRFSSNLNQRNGVEGSAMPTSSSHTHIHPHSHPPPVLQVQGEAEEKKYQPLSNDNLFDPSRPRYPSPVHFPHLAALFFDTLACHFPFLDRTTVMRQVEEGSLSAVLANCLAGLAIRWVSLCIELRCFIIILLRGANTLSRGPRLLSITAETFGIGFPIGRKLSQAIGNRQANHIAIWQRCV